MKESIDKIICDVLCYDNIEQVPITPQLTLENLYDIINGVLDVKQADTRNKMSPIKNLLTLIKKTDNDFFDDEQLNEIVGREIIKCENCIKYICD